MGKFEKIFTGALESVKSDLIDEYISQGRDASKNWIDQLEVNVKTTGFTMTGTIKGADYTYYMENGRQPNANIKNLRGFAAWMSRDGGLIYEWCMNKGISTEFAFPIAYNLGKNGYEGKPLVAKVITNSKIKDIVDKVGIGLINSFSSDIINEVKDGSN